MDYEKIFIKYQHTIGKMGRCDIVSLNNTLVFSYYKSE